MYSVIIMWDVVRETSYDMGSNDLYSCKRQFFLTSAITMCNSMYISASKA